MKITESQEVLTNLITSSFKSPDLFFYCQALDANLLDDRGDIIGPILTELINSSNGSPIFKAFSKKQITTKINQLLNNKELTRFIPSVHKNSIFNSPTLASDDLSKLIANGIPVKKLKELMSIQKKLDDRFGGN